jgi:hypothetical protein
MLALIFSVMRLYLGEDGFDGADVDNAFCKSVKESLFSIYL